MLTHGCLTVVRKNLTQMLISLELISLIIVRAKFFIAISIGFPTLIGPIISSLVSIILMSAGVSVDTRKCAGD